jgi:hypothetical protein
MLKIRLKPLTVHLLGPLGMWRRDVRRSHRHLKCGGSLSLSVQLKEAEDEDKQSKNSGSKKSIGQFLDETNSLDYQKFDLVRVGITSESKLAPPDYGRTARLKPGVMNHAHHPHQTETFHLTAGKASKSPH